MPVTVDTLLQVNVPEVKKAILKEYGKSDKDIEDCKKIMREWLKSQPHLPEQPSDKLIEQFLLINKYSIEKAKQKLDMYYTIRSLIPEMFENKNPNLPHMREMQDVVYHVPLPKLNPKDCNRIIYSKVTEKSETDKFNFERWISNAFNVTEVLLLEDFSLGQHFIYDCEFARVGHVSKFSPMAMKKSSIIMEKVYSNRIAAIHVVNVHPFLETLISMAKAMVPPKIAGRIHIHQSAKTLFDHYPKEILPKDIGGDEESLETLHDLWKEKFAQHKDRFDKLDKLRVNEHLRPAKLVNDDILGYHGSFKKLDVD